MFNKGTIMGPFSMQVEDNDFSQMVLIITWMIVLFDHICML
jgi:hypothetical protein